MKRVPGCSPPAPRTTISARRLVAPITLVGFTALSVLISTKRSAPASAAAARRARCPACCCAAPPRRCGLHQRHVLVGRGVEHHLRPPLAKRWRAGGPGPSRRRSAAPAASGKRSPSSCSMRVEVELAQLVQHQPRRGEARHLAAQLAADAAAGAGDQHGLAAARRRCRLRPAAPARGPAGPRARCRARARCRLAGRAARPPLGTVSTGRPVAGGQVQRAPALRRRGRRHGHDHVGGRAAQPRSQWPPAAPAPARRRCARPAWRGRRPAGPAPIQPCWWMPASSRRAASPAPITMARRTSASLPVMRARACS
jgi:hypothetical protein